MQSFLNSMYNALGAVLAFIYSLVPNLGVAIILLTLVVMLILYPLTAKQAKSMLAMQRVQPEIKKLQAKYKGDRQKLNEEMMKFYQENKINPLAGCLPLVVQLPIFFVLYRVLRTPWQHVPKTGSFTRLYNDMCSPFGSLCGKATTKLTSVTLASGVTKSIPAGGATSHLTHLSFLGVDLVKTATDTSLSFTAAIPYFVLVLLVVFTGYLQTKQAQARTPAANKQMNNVMKILPVFFGLISLSFPAGLVLYFVVSNTWRVGQQEVVFRHIGTAASPGPGKLGSGGRTATAIDVTSTERSPDAGEPSGTKSGDGHGGGNGQTRPDANRKAGRRPPPKAAPKPASRPPAPRKAPSAECGGLAARVDPRGAPPRGRPARHVPATAAARQRRCSAVIGPTRGRGSGPERRRPAAGAPALQQEEAEALRPTRWSGSRSRDERSRRRWTWRSTPWASTRTRSSSRSSRSHVPGCWADARPASGRESGRSPGRSRTSGTAGRAAPAAAANRGAAGSPGARAAVRGEAGGPEGPWPPSRATADAGRAAAAGAGGRRGPQSPTTARGRNR